ncbi:hypothetical protein FHS18_005545 [Paenibacillus phyllosphaerae]|uniref:Uncharacterized protein n=1 Tax=Paenibacillus phyllosphaerae TaxID=274593 RepID=A0A7W5B2W1_9BACL|nr:hypothetical protein [Paenibacillus phyllosphaerae]MBB3113433.1 hypothetical protein [Paenibacillus phyllosphaerae]
MKRTAHQAVSPSYEQPFRFEALSENEKKQILWVATRKFNVYQKCDEQLSFVFLACVTMLVAARYGKLFAISGGAGLTIFSTLSVIGIWIVIKKRLWQRRKIWLERQLEADKER